MKTNNILIIDDDLSIRVVLKKILGRILPNDKNNQHINVFTSEDGVDGLGYLFLTHPNLIIVDLTLPKYDGLEVIDYIRSNKVLIEEHAPTILVIHDSKTKVDLPDNFKVISKADPLFIERLVAEIKQDLHLTESKTGFYSWFITKIADLTINLANKSDYAIYKKQRTRSRLKKILHGSLFLLFQAFTSITLTIFYIFAGKGFAEENVEQQKSDLRNMRVKAVPAFAIILASLLLMTIQVSSFTTLVFTFFTLKNEPAQAATRTWDGGGVDNNWSTCANWSSDLCPNAADTAQFNATSTKNATIDAGFTGTVIDVIISVGYTGTITQSRNLVVTSNFLQSAGTYNGGSNTLDVNGTLQLTSPAIFTAPTNLSVAGAFAIGAGVTYNHNSGTVTLDGTGAVSVTCNGATLNFVVITGTGTKIVSTGCTLPLGNNPTIASTILLTGTLSGTGTVTFQNSLTLNAGASVTGFTNLTQSAGTFIVSGGTGNFGSYTTFDLNGAFQMSSGSFTAPSGNTSLAGALTITGGTFNANGGTFIFDGITTAVLDCNGVTFNLVQFAHTAGEKGVEAGCTLPLGNNPTISNSVSLQQGILTGSGTLTTPTDPLAQFTYLNDGLVDGFVGFTGLNSPAGTFSAQTGAVLDLSEFTSVNIDGYVFMQTNNVTFTAAPGIMNFGGEVFLQGVIFNANGGTVNFDGDTADIRCYGVTFNNVTFTHTGTKTLSQNCNLPLGNNPTVTGSLVMQSPSLLTGTGTLNFDANIQTITASNNPFSGFSGITVDGNANFDSVINFGSYSVADFNGNLSTTGFDFTAPSGNMTIAGDLIENSGWNFHHNNGTIIFDGGNQSLDAQRTQFNNFTKQTNVPATLTFLTYTLPEIEGTLTLTGTSGNLLSLRSNTPGVQAYVSFPGTRILDYLDVQDISHQAPQQIETAGLNITNSGNNTGWDFANTFTPWTEYNAYTGSGWDDILYNVNMITGEENASIAVNLAGETVQGITGLAYDPYTCTLYGVLELQSQTGRELVTINPVTGVATSIGDTGHKISGITFDYDNNLWAISGDGDPTNPETLYKLDTNNGTATLQAVLGNGDNGETIGFNPDDGYLYHASGSDGGTRIFERIDRDTFAITNIPITFMSDFSYYEIAGLVYSPQEQQFIIGINDNSEGFGRINSSGVVSNYLYSAGDLFHRGIALECTPFVAPNAPTNLGPTSYVDGSSAGDTTPTLNFDLTDPNLSDDLAYEIQIDNNSDFSSPEVHYISAFANQGTRNFTVGQAVGGGNYIAGSSGQVLAEDNYYWRVKAIDSIDLESSYTVANSGNIAFVVFIPIAPNTPTNLGPAGVVNGSTSNDTTPGFTFDMSDPNGSEQLRYRIVIDDDSDFSSPLVDYTSAFAAQGNFGFTVGQAISGGSYLIGSQGQTLPAGDYYWQVRAGDPTSLLSNFAVANGGSIAFVIDTTADLFIDVDDYTVEVGEAITITVESRDASDTIEPSYTGTVTFSSTSGTASLPSDYTFTGGDAGQRIFTDELIFNEDGVFTVTVTDINDGNFSDTTSNITVSVVPTPTPSPSPSPTPTDSGTPTPTPSATVSPTPTEIPDCTVNFNNTYCQQNVTISDVTVEETSSPFAVQVCWETNIPTIGSVLYGLKSGGLYTNTSIQESDYSTEHCVTISGLIETQDYIFKIISTSNAAKTTELEADFTGGNDCIINTGNGYSFSLNGQASINFQTISPASCSIAYGTNGNTSSSGTTTGTSHQSIIDLNNANGINDLTYQISCSVTIETEPEAILCSRAGIIPKSEYSQFTNIEPSQTPTTGNGSSGGFQLFGDNGIVTNLANQGSVVLRELSDDVIPVGLITAGGATVLANVLTYPRSIIFGFMWFRFKKRQKPWGIVFDQTTNLPVEFAVIRLNKINTDNSEEYVGQDVSSLAGKYGFKALPGKYKITVEQTGYEIFSKVFEIAPNSPSVSIDIPLLKSGEKPSTLSLAKDFMGPKLGQLNRLVFILGFIISLLALMAAFTAVNLLLFSLYLTNVLLLRLSGKPEGTFIFDASTGQKLAGIFVRVYDVKEGRQLDVQMTDATGSFNFKLDPGNYLVSAYANNYRIAVNKLAAEQISSLAGGQTAIKVGVANQQIENIEIPMEKVTNLQTGSSFGQL